ncbi:M23 family metallopeptidase [Sulfurimonas sp. MAG313]|nr:M23 family metallopeptidase [Sulfurimonas sp. MAG313]MDF1879943.1 M23 family metallopeptidase [Sulfurimonas sp. MAG313]
MKIKYFLLLSSLPIIFYFYTQIDIKIEPKTKTPKPYIPKIETSSYPKEQYSPGGLARLVFKHKPDVYLNEKKLKIFTQKIKNDWLVLIPFSLYKEANELRLTSSTSSMYQVHLFNLVEGKYLSQYINIKNKEFVKASEKTLIRIKKDRKLKQKTYSRHSKIYIKNLEMIKPLSSELRNDFGRRRFFNGVARSPHAGIDVSGKKGDKIKAPLDGEVIILGNLFYNGNMMVLDHGQGLISAYSHLSKFLKKDGDWVRQGEYIAEVGSTGRTTGPHLHWSVYLGGMPVNPELFLNFGKTPSFEVGQ